MDNNNPRQTQILSTPRLDNLTPEQEQVEKKKLKKLLALKKKLVGYAVQLTVLGFNSQRYDIPLIREYLPSSLIKIDEIPKMVIKNMSGYMLIATDKFKFLDILNYLAPGTSLVGFYKSYGVSVDKGSFPYSWFNSLDKMNETSLPPIEDFYSILKDKTITPTEYEICENTWDQEGMKTFEDFVRYYNNTDVIGFVEAVEKMVENEKVSNGLDMFKESVSLPGLTQRYLMKNLSPGDYFVGFGKEHERLVKLLRDNIVGGPSIIFHRYQEKDVTKIKNKFPCKAVIGYDANSLYLHGLGQKMPTGYYVLLDEKTGYIPETAYSHEAIQWLEHIMEKDGAQIRHAENGGEIRIENYSVDGFDESTNTIYEYYGCFWHKHFCHDKYDPKIWNKTIDRETFFRGQGYNVVSTTSCEWIKHPESKKWYSLPRGNPTPSTMEDIIDDVVNDRLFGFVKVDIHVPDHLIEKFSEFPPLFKNVEITIDDIGDHMQTFCRSIERKTGVKRSLISSMRAEGILLLTPLVKKYLEMGLIITRVELAIAYNGKPVFEWFMNEVVDDRRRADTGGIDLEMKGEASKLKGNSALQRRNDLSRNL